MARSATPRVFIGLRETAGYFVGLRDGFRQLGIPVTQVDLSADPFGYGQASGGLPRLLRWVARKKSSTKGPAGAIWHVLQGGLAGWVLITAMPRHDVFIFCAHNRAFMTVVYPLLRLGRKRVITVFLGSDVRPPYINAKSVGLAGPIDPRRLKSAVERTRGRLRFAERWSHYVVNHPPCAQFASRRFVDFLTLGIPYQAPPQTTRSLSAPPGKAVRILHAPSDNVAKGTVDIRRAIDALRSSNVPIDYVEISGRPHAEVIDQLELAQLVVAEAYSDQPMPGFATEAAAHGVPVVIGSEDWAGANHGLPPEAIPPTVQIHPRDLAKVIGELVLDPERRARLSRDGESFVRTRWSPAAVAARFLQLVSHEVPEHWYRWPADVGYVHGVGLPESRLREAVAALVRAYGVESLGLDANTGLRSRLLELANSGTGSVAS
jgi:hypothetical protein